MDSRKKRPRPAVVEPSIPNDKSPKRRVRFRNDYQGHSWQTLKHDEVPRVDTISVNTITPREFFDRYIGPRRPCILEGLAAAPRHMTITPERLVQVAGDQRVQLEQRHARTENFGQNRTPSRQFVTNISDFVQRLLHEKDGDLLYLSTQQEDGNMDQDNDAEEKPANGTKTASPFAIPCLQLLQHQLLEPALDWMGHLRLQSCNFWMGASTESTTSGLHHDYHDNMYLVVQGRKQFQLFSPDAAEFIDLCGTVDRVHPNGLISHVGSETRADGVAILIIAAGEAAEEGDQEEEEVVLGKGFDYGSESSLDSDDNDKGQRMLHDEDAVDDYDELVGDEENTTEKLPYKNKAAVDDDDDDGHEGIGERFDNSQSDNGESECDEMEDPVQLDVDGVVDDYDELVAEESNQEEPRPNSFSRMDPKLPPETLAREFPLFSKARGCTIDVKAGQMLYLPASWFHCVTSFSPRLHGNEEIGRGGEGHQEAVDGGDEKKETKSKLHRKAHIAINYWYQPPDQLDRFENPYKHAL